VRFDQTAARVARVVLDAFTPVYPPHEFLSFGNRHVAHGPGWDALPGQIQVLMRDFRTADLEAVRVVWFTLDGAVTVVRPDSSAHDPASLSACASALA